MDYYWDHLLLPLAEATQARRICEVGSEAGAMTAKVLEYCERVGGIAHVIEPEPMYDPAEWEARWADRLVFYRAKSLAVLDQIDELDMVLLDGDHNWYTVLNELRLVERHKPIVALHDVGWPYGRRDGYYCPDDIPPQHRQPHAQGGLHPDHEGFHELGVNADMENALREGGPANGVLTAVEDFVAEADGWDLTMIEGLHGLALVHSEPLPIDVHSPDFLLRHVRVLERARLDVQLRQIATQAGETRRLARLRR
jgi:hypothetical protein